MRIKELASELGMTPEELGSKARLLRIDAANPSDSPDSAQVDVLRSHAHLSRKDLRMLVKSKQIDMPWIRRADSIETDESQESSESAPTRRRKRIFDIPQARWKDVVSNVEAATHKLRALEARVSKLAEAGTEWGVSVARIRNDVSDLTEACTAPTLVTADLARRIEAAERRIDELIERHDRLAGELSDAESSRHKLSRDIAEVRGAAEKAAGIASDNKKLLDDALPKLAALHARDREAEERERWLLQVAERSRTLRAPRLTPRRDLSAVALEREGVFVSDQVLEQAIGVLDSGRPLLLVGPPGTGKSELAKKLPSLFSAPKPIAHTALPALVKWDADCFIGWQRWEDGVRRFELGVFSQAVVDCIESSGLHWLIIDEVSWLDPTVTFARLANTIDRVGDDLPLDFEIARKPVRIKIPESFRLICTRNNSRSEYHYPLEAIERRFGIVEVPTPTRDREERLLKHVLRNTQGEPVEVDGAMEELVARLAEIMERVRAIGVEHGAGELALGGRCSCMTIGSVVSMLRSNGKLTLDTPMRSGVVEHLSGAPSRVLELLASEVFTQREFPECNEGLVHRARSKAAARPWSA